MNVVYGTGHKRKWKYEFSTNLYKRFTNHTNGGQTSSVSRTSIWRYSNSESLPSILTLRMLADETRCSVNDLIPDINFIYPHPNPMVITRKSFERDVELFRNDVLNTRMDPVDISFVYPEDYGTIVAGLTDGEIMRYHTYQGIVEPYINYPKDDHYWTLIFSRRLKSELKRTRTPYKDFSEKTGISDGTIRSYLRSVRIPSVYNIALICEALHCAPSFLIPLKTGLFESISILNCFT